jgi:hypothetical protein
MMTKNESHVLNLYAGWEKQDNQQSIVVIKSFTEV